MTSTSGERGCRSRKLTVTLGRAETLIVYPRLLLVVNRKMIGVLALIAVLVVAGCTSSGLAPSKAVNGSEAVADISTQDNPQPSVQLTLEDPVQKNDEQCQYNPVLEMTQCYDNWHEVSLTQINVTRTDGSASQTFDASAGETINIPVPKEEASYKAIFESPDSPNTFFQFNVSVEEDKLNITSAGYNDQY